MSYPNQKIVTVAKEKCDKSNLYAKININALQKAMEDLRTNSFKLWVYFAKNRPYHTFALSAVDCKKWGIKTDSFHSAVVDLIKKGYLKQLKGNEYTFYETALSEKADIDMGKNHILL
ncbi:MAG: hypothetical protein IJV39_01510 [Ruminococcus sp.]|nr:hypothetical protein [Ruminococcus sp.]